MSNFPNSFWSFSPNHRQPNEREKMRYLAIGDIHGCSQALETILNVVQPQSDDLIITLGDYVNKGPDSRGVIEKLIYLSHNYNLIALKGNHDLLFLQSRFHSLDYCLENQLISQETLLSYADEGQELRLENIPDSHWSFIFHNCLNSWENETHIFVHANLNPELPLEQQSEHQLFWEKFVHPLPHYSGKTMICGHTCQRSGKPVNLGHAICLDTWACGKGWLTCLDVYGGQLWQANQKGDIQIANIEDFLIEQE
jgi:serine/threonine protein phosphatase 1